jgi:ATP-dependent phosphofructokinase / diphosphate-dependent phosphofructokinase
MNPAPPKGTIAILTGGGDVPGLNPAIRALTVRAIREGYRVIGIRRGWAGLLEYSCDKGAENKDCVIELSEKLVNKVGRTGGTFLHTSRTRPSHVPRSLVPPAYTSEYSDDINDMTPVVLKNLEHLGVETLIPIGGDDTLSYGVRLHEEGIPVIAIPKTMDNDVPGTDYCIGFSTCVTRTIELTHALRTSAGSHERFLVLEVFGRYAGFTALMPTLAGAANRCVIPEYQFDSDRLCELLVEDRYSNPSKYSVVLVSEGARFHGMDKMRYKDDEADMFGHRKLGGVGDLLSHRLKSASPSFNRGKRVNVISQRMGYLVRCGDPDATDSIVPMAFGNLAMDLVLKKKSGRLISIRDGRYTHLPIRVVTQSKKLVDLDKLYEPERLRPTYDSFEGKPLLIMTDI